MRAHIHWIVLVLCAAGFTASRTWPAIDIVLPAHDDPSPLGTDAYYHVRHARQVLDTFPHIARFDVFTNFPVGELTHHSGLFNVFVAGLAVAMAGREPVDDATLLAASVWSPILLGLLALAALYALSRRLLPPLAATAPGVVFLLYPGASLMVTTLGFGDQHVAEILLTLLTLLGATWCLQRPASAWWKIALASLPLAVLHWTWPGAPMILLWTAVALFAAVQAALFFNTPHRPLTRAIRIYGSTFAGWILVVGAIFPSWLCLPGDLLALVAGGGALALWPTLNGVAVERASRVGIPRLAAASGFVAVTGGLTLIGATSTASGRLLVDIMLTPKSAHVAEHVAMNAPRFLYAFGIMGVLAILAAPVVAVYRVARQGEHVSVIVPIAFALLQVFVFLRTHDYGYQSAPLLALLFVYAFWGVLGRETRLVRAVAFCILLLPPLWPARACMQPWFDTAAVQHLHYLHRGWLEAMDWMQRVTPAPPIEVPVWNASAHDFDYGTAGYGVLAAWDFGNFVSLFGRRPVVASHFPNERSARWFTSTRADEAREILAEGATDGERVRYVVADADTASRLFLAKVLLAGRPPRGYADSFGECRIGGGQVPVSRHGDEYNDSTIARLYLQDGRNLPGIRLVYESPSRHEIGYTATLRGRAVRTVLDSTPLPSPDAPLPPAATQTCRYDVQRHASIKVFEVVAGAYVDGVAPPGARVRAELALASATTGRRVTVSRTTIADDGGRFSVRLPYASEPSPTTDVVAEGPWRFVLETDSGQRAASLSVSERAVQEGETLNLSQGDWTSP